MQQYEGKKGLKWSEGREWREVERTRKDRGKNSEGKMETKREGTARLMKTEDRKKRA